MKIAIPLHVLAFAKTTAAAICSVCPSGLVDPDFIVNGLSCKEISDFGERLDETDSGCPSLLDSRTLCCPDDFVPSVGNPEIGCEFCEDGLDNPDLKMPGQADHITCALIEANKQVTPKANCSSLVAAEFLCCPQKPVQSPSAAPPTGSNPNADVGCRFCEDGVENPDLIMLGQPDHVTCSFMAATKSLAPKSQCRNLFGAEILCCPPKIPQSLSTSPPATSSAPGNKPIFGFSVALLIGVVLFVALLHGEHYLKMELSS